MTSTVGEWTTGLGRRARGFHFLLINTVTVRPQPCKQNQKWKRRESGKRAEGGEGFAAPPAAAWSLARDRLLAHVDHEGLVFLVGHVGDERTLARGQEGRQTALAVAAGFGVDRHVVLAGRAALLQLPLDGECPVRLHPAGGH